MAKWAYHPEASVVKASVICWRLVYSEYKVKLQGKIYFNPCAKEIINTTYP